MAQLVVSNVIADGDYCDSFIRSKFPDFVSTYGITATTPHRTVYKLFQEYLTQLLNLNGAVLSAMQFESTT